MRLGFPARLQCPASRCGEGLAPGDPRSSTSAAKPQRTSLLSRENCLEPSSAPAAASGTSSHPRPLLAVTSSLPVVSLSTSSQAHAQAAPDLVTPANSSSSLALPEPPAPVQQFRGSEDPDLGPPTSMSAPPPHPKSAALLPAQGQPQAPKDIPGASSKPVPNHSRGAARWIRLRSACLRPGPEDTAHPVGRLTSNPSSHAGPPGVPRPGI